MNTPLNLKDLEKKAFRSFYQDGIWDIFFGLIMLAMYLFTLFNDAEQKAVGTIGFILAEIIATFFLIFGKKYITVPRLGNVEFGKARKKRLVVVMGMNIITLLLGLGVFLAADRLSLDKSVNDLLIPLGFGFWITFLSSMMAYFLDFDRLYIYGFLYGAAFGAVLLLDIPILFLVAAVLILVPGLILFTRFLRNTQPVQER